MEPKISSEAAGSAKQRKADGINRQRRRYRDLQPRKTFRGAEFALFTHFPAEIRDMIWELAIPDCDALPKAHWFSLPHCADMSKDSTCTFYEPMRVDREAPIKHNLGQERFQDQTPLGASDFERHLERYRPKARSRHWRRPDSPTAYTNTNGLWLACHESFAVMVRNRKRGAYARGNAPRHVKLVRIEKDPEKPFHLINMQQDLLAIQTRGLSEYQGHSIVDLAKRGFCGSTVRNIGLEYDQGWALRLNLQIPFTSPWQSVLGSSSESGTIARLAGKLTRDTSAALWFLDTTFVLRPRFLQSEEIAHRRTFRVKHGRYVEVVFEDMDDRYLECTSWGPPAFLLVQWLHDRCDYASYARQRPYLPQCLRIGVLARVPDASD